MTSQNAAPAIDLPELTRGTNDGEYDRMVNFFGTMLSKTILNDLSHADLPFVQAGPGASVEDIRVQRLWQILRTAVAYEARDYLRKARAIEVIAHDLGDTSLHTLADIEWMALRARLDSVERDPIGSAQRASATLAALEQLAAQQGQSPDLLEELQLICLLFNGPPVPFTAPWSVSSWLVGRGSVLFVDMANLAVWSHGGEPLADCVRGAIERFLRFMDQARQRTHAVDPEHLGYVALRLARLAAVALPHEAQRYLDFVMTSNARKRVHVFRCHRTFGRVLSQPGQQCTCR